MWKQKGEEYRLFGGGGWVWTSGLQLRKRKHPGDEKDNFVNKKRKLLHTTNKIVALKEAKRKEVLKQEAEKAARMATQRAPLQSTSVSQTIQSATTTTAASAPVQTSATTSSSTAQSAPLSLAVQTTTTTAASATVQTSAAISSTTQSAASQSVQTTATTTAVTGPAQTAVTVQTTAAPTSATLTPAASSQMVQATVTTAAMTGAAQSTSAAFTPAASSQSIQSAAITTASDFPAQTSVFSQSAATSTCTSAAQSSVQNVVSTHNEAGTSPSAMPCALTTATSTGISTNTFSALPVVVSQNASPAPTSVIPSVSASETTGNPVSAGCVFSPIPSTTSVLSGPEVQTSSGTALSTPLLTASNSSEASSGEKDTSASSSLVVNTDNSENKCLTPPSSSATIDIVSTTSSSALSSVTAASISKSPSPLPASSATVEDDNLTSSSLVLANDSAATPPLSSATTDVVWTTSSSTLSSVSTASMSKSSYPADSSANLLYSNSTGVSLSTETIENHDHFPEVESKPDTLSGVGCDTLGSSDLYEANVSQSSAIPSPTTEVSGDVGKTAVSPSLSCQEPEDQAFATCQASPSPLTGANVKSRSEVLSSSFPEQNVTESTVAQDSSPSDPYLPQNPSPCIPFSAEASQGSELNSKCGTKNEVLLGSSLCSNQVSLVGDDVPDGVKEENASSASDSQPHAEELVTDLSKDNSETITRKNKHELSPDSDFVEQGSVQDKSVLLQNHSISSTEEQISEQDGRLANLSDMPMTSNDQEDLDHTKENAAESKVTSSDVYVLESSAVQTKEETEKGFQSSEGKSLVCTQDTRDRVTDETRLNDTVLPDNRDGHPSLLSKEASSVGPTEESEKVSKFENWSVDNSGNKVDISDDGVFPSDSLVNECLTLGNDTQEGKAADVAGVSAGTTKEDSNECGQTTALNDSSLGSGENFNSDFDLEDASVAANDNFNIGNNGECKEPKSIEQSECCTLDITRSEHVINHDEAASLSDLKATVSTTISAAGRTQSCTERSVAAEPSAFDSSSPLKGDSIGSFANAIPDDSHENETNAEDVTTYDSRKDVVVKESSDGGESGEVNNHLSSEANVCQSVDSVEVTESIERPSSAKPASSALEKSLNSAEEPMDIDVTTASPNQSLAGVTSPPKCTNLHTEAEQPMDVDVTTVSSTQSSKATTTPLTSDVLKHSQTVMSTEKTATSVESTSVPGPVLEETETKTSKENLPDIAVTQPCLTPALSSVSTASAGGIATTSTANVPVMKITTSVSSTLSSATTAALSTASLSRSATQPSGLVKSAATTVSQSLSSTASSAAATVSLKTTASLDSQPVMSVVPSSAALASPRVAVAGSQGRTLGGSSVAPLPQTILAKSGGSPSVVTAAVTRGIAPQKIGLAIRPQGQTSQFVPIGPKPILPSPKTPALNTGVQGSNIVRIGTQPAASGQTGVAPVNSIAALVASIPTSGTTIGPSQLIRLVTPDGRTLTLQGSQLAALAQQAASPLGLSAPKTITLQVSATASQQNPGTPVQKTIGIKTPGAAITVQRPTQQVAQAKPQVVIKPKVETKPLKEEKFPSLEPVIKDPRALLNRRLAKWPLRHSVKSVFALPKHERRKLGRKAGLKEVRGYTYASRAVGVHWPAGIPRPSFKVAWRFRTQSLKTLAGAGLQLRILQSCLKWEEMNVRPPRGNSNTVYTSSGEVSYIPLVHGNAWFDSLQLVVGSASNNEPTDCNRVATGREIVREQNSSRSGKSQEILF